MDLISRQVALDALKRDEEYDEDIPNRADGVRDAIITISNLPSADVVEVVRCKDCVHYNNKACRKLHTMQIKRTDFCSFGERRE